MKNKLRPLGQITDDIEVIMEELVEQHKLQMGEILYLIYCYLRIHYPDCIEEFKDGTHPIFKYD
jgi:hypothetical protein